MPYAARRTGTGTMLLLYRGGAKHRTHYASQSPWSDATQRRFRWQVYPGGKR
jgi:hypothetical protein